MKLEELRLKLKKLYAKLLQKTYLGNYMFNMEIYEMKHYEQDSGPRVRK